MKNMLKTRATFTFCATISTLPLAGLMTHPLMVLLFPDKSTKNTISLKIQMEIETKLVQVVYLLLLLLLLLLLQTTTTDILVCSSVYLSDCCCYSNIYFSKSKDFYVASHGFKQ